MKNSINTKVEAGFTLIELLVGVSLSVMLMLAASTLFMSFLISSTKVSANQLVKNEGQQAINQMEFLIRNAVELVGNTTYPDGCQEDMSALVLRSIDGGATTLRARDDNGVMKIASNSGVFLTSDSVELTAGPTFDCTESADGLNEYVEITFTLRKGAPGVDQPTEIVEETFVTGVNVRSF